MNVSPGVSKSATPFMKSSAISILTTAALVLCARTPVARADQYVDEAVRCISAPVPVGMLVTVDTEVTCVQRVLNSTCPSNDKSPEPNRCTVLRQLHNSARVWLDQLHYGYIFEAQAKQRLAGIATKALQQAADLGPDVSPNQQPGPHTELSTESSDPSHGVAANTQAGQGESVPLKSEGGTFVLPVLINGKITLDFLLDSGAADVSIPRDVFSTLRRTQTISNEDLLKPGEYQLADGSTQRQQRFRIRSLKVGSVELRDVVGSVAPTEGTLLLGQSFLSRLQTWSVDNQRHVLVINGTVAKTVAHQPPHRAAGAGTPPPPHRASSAAVKPPEAGN
jgi:clan AA aspartic protease (TIGR02281 family)